MTDTAHSFGWLLVPVPGLVLGLFVFGAMRAIFRNRRWRDRGRLGRAIGASPEHVAREPKEVRDLKLGETGWVSRNDVVASEKDHRVYVGWTARVEDEPEDPDSQFAPLRVVRLKRGFSITLRPGLEIRTSPLPWGYYAPVIEITQRASNENQPAGKE